jgi:hypothetical protein
MARLILPALLFVCLYAVASAVDEQPKVPNKEELHLQTMARVEQINKSQKRWTVSFYMDILSFLAWRSAYSISLIKCHV